MAEKQVPKLSEIYQEINKIYDDIEKGDEPSSSDNIQVKLRKGIAEAEKAIHMVNELNLFSTNESIEEVATNEIKYMLLPAYCGFFILQKMRADRLETVTKSQNYYLDFLRLCKFYSLTDIEVPSLEKEIEKEEEESQNPNARKSSGAGDLLSMARQRHSKIERFKQEKEIENRLQELSAEVEKPHVDEDVKRDYYIVLINRWISRSLSELESIDSEIQILKYMDSKKSDSGPPPKSPRKEEKKPAFRPFILTKDQIQAKVIGAGYPSLPTYTVEQFYEQQAAAGRLPKPEEAQNMQQLANDPDRAAKQAEKEEAEKEQKVEQDDPETLKKAREWDDWKDDHRRGWGNRDNRS